MGGIDTYDGFRRWYESLGYKDTKQYRAWKYSNDISNYDDRILRRIYELEREIEKLENFLKPAKKSKK